MVLLLLWEFYLYYHESTQLMTFPDTDALSKGKVSGTCVTKGNALYSSKITLSSVERGEIGGMINDF
jgi:hypothetical protein